jgi:hypothetical protein
MTSVAKATKRGQGYTAIAITIRMTMIKMTSGIETNFSLFLVNIRQSHTNSLPYLQCLTRINSFSKRRTKPASGKLPIYGSLPLFLFCAGRLAPAVCWVDGLFRRDNWAAHRAELWKRREETVIPEK